jgi:hypothetical protein
MNNADDYSMIQGLTLNGVSCGGATVHHQKML